MTAVLRAVNRTLTGLLGLLLIAAGGYVLAVGLGVRPPSWWIRHSRHDVLLGAAERTRWQHSWWWPVVLVGLIVLFLLALWWLAAVLRRRRLTVVRVDTGDGAGALLRGRALEAALAADTARQEGVAHARIRLTGRRTAPGARMRLHLAPDADPETVLHALTTRTLPHGRDATGLAALPAEVRLRTARHRAERVT